MRAGGVLPAQQIRMGGEYGMNREIERFRGCILGGAAGDALGYPVEFYGEAEILRQFGAAGVTRYAPRGGIAEFSDDTQMTLFTANGLLLARAQGIPAVRGIRAAYLDWYQTQCRSAPSGAPHAAWLANENKSKN